MKGKEDTELLLFDEQITLLKLIPCLFFVCVLHPQMTVNLQRARTVKVHPFHLWKKGKFGTVNDGSLREEGGMRLLYYYFFNFIKSGFYSTQRFGLVSFTKGSTSKLPACLGV